MKFIIWGAALFGLAMVGCDTPDTTPQDIGVSVSYTVNGEALRLDEEIYTSEDGLTYSISDVKTYLSNVVLTGTDEATYTEPDSYHLIAAGSGAATFTLTVPAESVFTGIRMGIGVDSMANLSLDARGDLNPSNDMAWNWNTGYKFVLLEGAAVQADSTVPLVFHIGGSDNYNTVSYTFDEAIDLGWHSEVQIHLTLEIGELFRNPNTINFGELNTLKFDPEAALVAENWLQNYVQLGEVTKVTTAPNPN